MAFSRIHPLLGEHDEAKRHPDGFVYRIDGKFGIYDAVPPERIIGCWSVDGAGKLTGEFLPNPNYIPSAAKIRKFGFQKFILGTIIFAGTIVAFFYLARHNDVPNDPHLLMLAGIPFVYVCIGIVEFISGTPFGRLADVWMALRGWQRGVIGVLLILASMFAIICLAALIAMKM